MYVTMNNTTKKLPKWLFIIHYSFYYLFSWEQTVFHKNFIHYENCSLWVHSCEYILVSTFIVRYMTVYTYTCRISDWINYSAQPVSPMLSSSDSCGFEQFSNLASSSSRFPNAFFKRRLRFLINLAAWRSFLLSSTLPNSQSIEIRYISRRQIGPVVL